VVEEAEEERAEEDVGEEEEEEAVLQQQTLRRLQLAVFAYSHTSMRNIASMHH